MEQPARSRLAEAGSVVGVTMTDVARLAGVSPKTVSNVINGYPHIREETRARVLAAIAELRYEVNVSARTLRTGRSGLIGLAVPELKLPYFAELADSVIVEAERVGLTVLIQQTGGERRREIEVLHGPRRHLTDGLIYSPLALGQEDKDLLAVDFPLVVLGERIFGGPADHVTMSNVEAARAATQHLVDTGRRRIALVGAHTGERVGSAALRRTGYLQALESAGIAADPALVAEAGPWHRETGAEATFRLLDAGVGVDAVFALNDALAIGVLHALHARDVGIPGEVAVMGFDDVEDARFTSPPLSSVSPGREEIARTAVRLLKRRIEERGTPSPPESVTAAFELVVRASTAGAAPAEPAASGRPARPGRPGGSREG